MSTNDFAKGTEQLVDPVAVGSIHFLQQFVEVLPRLLQRTMLKRASRKTPYMGFVVEPYAFFLFTKVTDEARASALLPRGFKLAKACVFEGDEPASYAITSFFRVHTSAFWGARAEFYLVAESERTGMLSWVIVDYLSDTISYDRAHGLRAASASHAVVTTTAQGSVLVDVERPDGSAHSAFEALLQGSCVRQLDPRLWLEGNMSVAYGRKLSHGKGDVFSLTFPPSEMAQALDVPLEGFSAHSLAWHEDLLAEGPTKLVCFPYAQHLLSDSPGQASGYASIAQLEQAAQAVDFTATSSFAVQPARPALLASTLATVGIAGLLAFLAFRHR